MNAEISVLLPIYYKTIPAYLSTAIESVLAQTLRPDELVIVCDGKLSSEVENILTNIPDSLDPIHVTTVRLSHNQGLGLALREGVSNCRNEIIARIDDDDISVDERFETQFGYLQANPNISLVGSWLDEFIIEGESKSVRRVPADPDEIIRYAKFRNPVNHPSVMFRKSDVIGAGNYRSMPFFEDYDLWVRMLQSSLQLANIPKCLVLYRMDEEFYQRRHGRKYVKCQTAFFKTLLASKFINRREYLGLVVLRSSPFLLPVSVKSLIYKLLRWL